MLAGLQAGLFATFLSTTAIAFAQVGWTAAVDLGWDDALRASLFAIVAIIVSSLAARQREAMNQLKKADHAKDEFLAMLSHELRTPLTSILGWATLLSERALDAETIAAAAESIKQSARSQQLLVDDLLDFSRIVFAKFQIDAHPIDLIPLAEAAAKLIRPAAEAKHIELRTELPQQPCVIDGDGQRIRQVMWNFLTNAVKFTPPGGEVNLRVEIADAQARLVVSDNGEGIEPKSLPHVFERFRQSESGAKKGGLGLGLAIARYVVEAHHGSVSAMSDGVGHGATFIARFPLAT